jgi:membrane protein required for colicin V production
MNALDLVLIAGIALSALLAFARGFVKEALSIAAWGGAAMTALYSLPYARPYARQLISNQTLADAAAGLTLFIVSLIVYSILTSLLAGRIKHSALSAIDRALGLLFGIFRGIIIACLAFIAFNWAVPERDWPGFVRDARTRPFIAQGAELLKSLVPSETREKSAAAANQAHQTIDQAREAEALMRALTSPNPTAAAPAGGSAAATAGTAAKPSSQAMGYKPQQRREMDQLMDSLKDK